MYDYQEALQSPSYCFKDPDLKDGEATQNSLGLPRPVCGMFASVYEIERKGRRWAAKCFLRNIPDLHNRYKQISLHLGKCNLPYFVDFDHQEEGIRVQGQWFPLAKMEWVKGSQLNEYLEKNLNNKKKLQELEKHWAEMLRDIEDARIGHADLQHGNVLVTDAGELKLIDYDGMWVPALKGKGSHEMGHPDYQSPQRTEKDFDLGVDEFSGNVIQMSIRALSLKPELWKKYNNGDNLLFRRGDYLDPKASKLIAEIFKLGDDELRTRLEELVHGCGFKVKSSGRSKAKSKSKAKAKSSTPSQAKAKAKAKASPSKPKAKSGGKAKAAKTKSNAAAQKAAKQAARQAAKQARKAKQAAKQAARQKAKAAKQQAKASAQKKTGTAAKSGTQPKPQTGTQPAGKASSSSSSSKGSAGAAALSWVSQHVTRGGRANAPAKAKVAKPTKAPKPAKAPKPSRQARKQARQQARDAKRQAREAAKQAKLAAKQAKRAAKKNKARKPPVAAVAPGARPARSPTGRSENGRTFVHMLALAPVMTATVMQLQLTFLHGANASRAVFLAAGGVATLAGLASFATLFALRKYHWNLSRHFFGLGIAMALAKTAYEAPAGLGKGDIPWLALMGILLLANAAGAIVETVHRRRAGGRP
jgi:serine/threonine protein kinase